MADLYIIFFAVGLLLFAVVVGISYLQQQRRRAADDERLITVKPKKRRESQKSKTSTSNDEPSVVGDESAKAAPSISANQPPRFSDDPIAEGGYTEPAKTHSVRTKPIKTKPFKDKAAKSEVLDQQATKAKPLEKSPVETSSANAKSADNKPVGDGLANKYEKNRDTAAAGSQTEPSSDNIGALKRAKAALSSMKKGARSEDTKSSSKIANPQASVANSSSSEPAAKIEPSLAPILPEADSTDKAVTKGKHTKIVSDANSVITDLVAKVMNPNPIEQSDLLGLFREHDFKFHRKVHIYGLNELTDMWRDIEFELPSARFLELGVSIQLCDREGAMSEKESHDFQQMVLQFCDRYDAPFEFSMDLEAALQQAQALDRIGRRYDSMAVLNVVPKSKAGFRMADIQSCARDLMMSTDKSGIFLKTEGQKNNITVLFRLACTDGEGHFGIPATGQALATPVHDLVVYMNVPATREPELVFQQMVKDANDLAVWLDGKVVDRSGKAMNQRTYSTLMQQISDIAYSMQQDGLVPGDAVSKKLF